MHGGSKHIDIRYHFISECVENGEIIVKHVSTEEQRAVSTEEQRADPLTKALTAVRFKKMWNLLRIKKWLRQVLIKREFVGFLI